MSLKIIETFTSLQEEGPFVGELSVFIRLHGCNKSCEICDEKHEDWEELEVIDILNKVSDEIKENPGIKAIIIGGGEPAIQDISKLILGLDGSFVSKIIIETNFTEPVLEYIKKTTNVHYICTPKILNIEGYALIQDLIEVKRGGNIHFNLLFDDMIDEHLGMLKTIKYNSCINIQPISSSKDLKEKFIELCNLYKSLKLRLVS
jgi:organic radical activating enzyme